MSSHLTALSVGARMSVQRLRGKAGLGVTAATILAIVVVALVERRESAYGASDRTLAGLFRIILPFALFSFAYVAFAGKNVREAVWPAARFGLHRGFVAAGGVLGASAFAAVASLVIALVGVLAARVGRAPLPHEMSLAADLFATAWITPLVAAAYVAWFSFGATFGKVGGGRTFVLMADFMVGGLGFFGLLLPRGSAYNLIGLTAPLELPQRAASGVLVAVFLLVTLLGALRCRA